MDDLRVAPTVGIVGCLLYLLALAAPYAIIETAGAASTYYDAGALSPLIPGALTLVTVIVLAAGREGRSDPSVAAGASLVAGLFVVGLSLAWALTVPEEVVLTLTESTLIEYHRWVLVVAAAPIPLGAAWFAKALNLL